MKKCLLVFLLTIQIISAQNWQFAKSFPKFSSSNDVLAATLDSADNVYAAGVFEECYHCGGANGFFVCKIDPEGTIIWMDTIVTPPHYARLIFNDAYISDEGRITVTGFFVTTKVNFFGFLLNANTPYKTGFYAEFDNMGNCLNAATLPYVPNKTIKNNDGTLSVLGHCDTTFSNLNFTPANGDFVGNFQDPENAVWIKDLHKIFNNSSNLTLVSDEKQRIFHQDDDGNVRRYDSLNWKIITNSRALSLEYSKNKLYCISGDDVKVVDTSSNIVYQKAANLYAPLYSSFFGDSLVIAGFYRDSLRFGSAIYNSSFLGTAGVFVLKMDSTLNLSKALFSIPDSLAVPCGGSGTNATAHYLLTGPASIYLGGNFTGNVIFNMDTIHEGCFDPSGAFYTKISYQAVTAIKNNPPSEFGVSVFPNPAQNQFTIRYNGNSSIKRIQIRNQLGQLVYSKEVSAHEESEIHITLNENFKKGVYFAEAWNTEGKVVTKIILD